MKLKKIYLFVMLCFSVSGLKAYGSMGGGHSLGGSFIFTSPTQNDMDALISRSNTRAGGISTQTFGSGYEFSFQYAYRISGTMFQLIFRPSIFNQSRKGSATTGAYAGAYNYALDGWTLFPIFRIIPLENSFIKFFMQVGLGYGSLSGSIQEANANVQFSHTTFGGLAGLGAEFCFTDTHCMVIEGNMRYLPFERNVASGGAGSFSSNSINNGNAIHSGDEVEIDGRDLGTTMTGFQAIIGYTFNF